MGEALRAVSRAGDSCDCARVAAPGGRPPAAGSASGAGGVRDAGGGDTAVGVFGPRVRLAEEYASLLAGPGLERGLIGPREVGRLWERHLFNCAVVGELIPEGVEVVDIGSGAGLPGMALAIARPDLTVTLVESRLRPTAFLEECVERLGLTSLRVRRARAEHVSGSMRADVVTARAVGPLLRLAEWSRPLLTEGGQLLALKGEGAEGELGDARPKLGRLEMNNGEVLSAGSRWLAQPTTVVRLVARSNARGGGRKR